MFFVMIICVMFLDCFFVIFYLFVYNFENKGCCINCILVFIWLLGLFLFMLYLMGFGFSYNYYFWFWCFLNFVGGIIKDCINLFIYFIIGLFILLCIIVVNVVVILSVCRKMRCNSVKFVWCVNVNIIVFFVVIVIVFIMCWVLLMVSVVFYKC